MVELLTGPGPELRRVTDACDLEGLLGWWQSSPDDAFGEFVHGDMIVEFM